MKLNIFVWGNEQLELQSRKKWLLDKTELLDKSGIPFRIKKFIFVIDLRKWREWKVKLLRFA